MADDPTLAMLRQLTNAHGVSGYEGEVRQLMRGYLEPYGEISVDRLGSLICKLHGNQDGPRVMLAAHMDEIGFMVKHITKDGFLKFLQLGGWWDQVLLGQRVIVKSRKGDVPGVIGAMPPHLMSLKERARVVEKKEMYIDIGALSKDDVGEAGIRPGDPVVPAGEFQELALEGTYLAKAFDNRAGCALVVQTLDSLQGGVTPNVLYGVATVQEELPGDVTRGGKTVVSVVKPDVALVLDVDIAGDVPGIKPEQSSVKMGGGPVVGLYDARMIPNLKLRDLVLDTAEELGIPAQISLSEGGATDGSAIHLYEAGVPTLNIGVPARHIHSHGAIMRRDDYEATLQLVNAVVGRLDAGTVAGLTSLD